MNEATSICVNEKGSCKYLEIVSGGGWCHFSQKCEGIQNKLVDKIENCPRTNDTVKQPTHYTTGPIECIDAIRSALTEEEFRGYCKGNVLKYTWREKLKGGDEDLKKAGVYLSWLTNTQKQ